MNAIFLLLFTTIAVSYSKPIDSAKDAKILKYENEVGPDGTYRFAYETSDGTSRDESGGLVKIGDEEILVVRGSYSYLDDKGERHSVSYVADGGGYRIVQVDKSVYTGDRTAGEGTPIFDVTPISQGGPGGGGRTSNRIDPTVLGTLVGGGVS